MRESLLLHAGVIGAPEPGLARVTPCSLLHGKQQYRVARMRSKELCRWTGEMRMQNWQS